MTLQNRVTPFGDIVAIPQRGLVMGNRGIIHDPETRTLLKRRWTNKAWIICVCDFQGRRREVMGGRSWTELFFLDESIALAAGHRPCFFCRRDAARAFQAAWADGRGDKPPTAGAMDVALHAERMENGRQRVHRLSGTISGLPDGAVVVAADAAFTIAQGLAFRWTEGGYQQAPEMRHADGLLTPPSTLVALRAGYRPILHPSIIS